MSMDKETIRSIINLMVIITAAYPNIKNENYSKDIYYERWECLRTHLSLLSNNISLN